jgi:hypothetical protein
MTISWRGTNSLFSPKRLLSASNAAMVGSGGGVQRCTPTVAVREEVERW